MMMMMMKIELCRHKTKMRFSSHFLFHHFVVHRKRDEKKMKNRIFFCRRMKQCISSHFISYYYYQLKEREKERDFWYSDLFSLPLFESKWSEMHEKRISGRRFWTIISVQFSTPLPFFPFILSFSQNSKREDDDDHEGKEERRKRKEWCWWSFMTDYYIDL